MLTDPRSIPIEAAFGAAERGDVHAAMRDFYAEVDRRVSALQATCWNRGACCRFGAYGHRLFVTTLETAYYLSRGEPERDLAGDACPQAFDGLCHVRSHRPMGCRIFFCDPAAQAGQGPLTEALLAQLRGLHESLGVTYFYADWMAVLSAIEKRGRDARPGRGG